MPEDGRKVFFIEEDDRHEYGAGFLGHSECCLRMATSLQHTDINKAESSSFQYHHHYSPTSGHNDSEADNFYQQLQETINQTQKNDTLVLQGYWNDKMGEDARADWRDVCGSYCNVKTNERGLRLLELDCYS